jgi:hypothetical protein
VSVVLRTSVGRVAEPRTLVLTVDGLATFAAVARTGVLIDGAGTATAVLQSSGGEAAIELTPGEPGLLSFRVDGGLGSDVALQPRIEEDFEASDGGFRHGGNQDEWELGTPTSGPRSAYSGDRVWATDLDGTYEHNSNAYLETPTYVFPEVPPGRMHLEFSSWFSFYSACCDRGLLLASVDGDEFDVIPGVVDFLGTPRTYLRERFDVTHFAGHSVQIRFVVQTDGFDRDFGWYVDDWRVEGFAPELEVVTANDDSDQDGVVNAIEVVSRTDPLAPDTDSDWLLDGVESDIGVYVDANDTGTDARLRDTDAGGMCDGIEVLEGLDPLYAGDDFATFEENNGIPPFLDADGYRWRREGPRVQLHGQLLPLLQTGLLNSQQQIALLGPQAAGGLELVRETFVPAKGPSFVRHTEILHNPWPDPFEVSLRLENTLPLGSTVVTSSGDANVSTGDEWIVTFDESRASATAFVLSGPGSQLKDVETRLEKTGTLHWSYEFTVPPRETVAVVYFIALSTAFAEAVSKAELLFDATHDLPPELAHRVLNFDLSRSTDALLPGDCNDDVRLDLSDGICLLEALFLRPPEEVLPCVTDSGNLVIVDVNGDLRINIADPIYLFGYLFLGSAPPTLGTGCVEIEDCGHPSRCDLAGGG